MDTIAMDTYPFVAAGALVVDDVFTQRDRCSVRAGATAARRRGRFSVRRGPANDGKNCLLRTGVRRAIITVIAQLLPVQIALRRSIHDHHRRRPRRPH